MSSDNFIESMEALSWLERSDSKERIISEDSGMLLSSEDALKLVRELYAAGATEVLVRDIEVEDDLEDASSLVVNLPKDPKARAALFVIEARVLEEMGSSFDPEGEKGQDSFGLGW